jgi:hypothetical protein
VVAIVEGQTERTFVRDVLAPWLGWKGVMLTARLIGKPGHKGGIGEFARAKNEIANLLKQEAGTVITTMFDFYGMPTSWPGRAKASKAKHENKAKTVEEAIKEALQEDLGSQYDERRLIPYVQMHEYEALLFSQPNAISEVMRAEQSLAALEEIRNTFESPEHINDSPETAPSKRLEALFPFYQKTFHGILTSKMIAVETMRSECPHFDEWLTILESLATEDE